MFKKPTSSKIHPNYIIALIITLMIAAWIIYLMLTHPMIRQANRAFPLNFSHVYILDRNQYFQGDEDNPVVEVGAFYFLRPLDLPPNHDLLTGSGMIIGSSQVENLEQFYRQKVRIRGRRYFGPPLVVENKIFTADWSDALVVEILEIELAE